MVLPKNYGSGEETRTNLQAADRAPPRLPSAGAGHGEASPVPLFESAPHEALSLAALALCCFARDEAAREDGTYVPYLSFYNTMMST